MDKYPMPSSLENILTIQEFKELAKRRVPKMFFDYADSGSWTETTYRENESDFQKIALRQRVAVNMEGRSLKTEMVGQAVSMPVALAPTGLTGMQIADGEIKAAKAAEKFMRDRTFIERLIDRAKAAKCSALVLTMDLQILGQRHKDIRNGLSAPPKFTAKHVWQMASRPSWALGMLGTKRRSFGNLVGHVDNLGDLRQLSAWTSSQFDPTLSWTDIAWVKERFGGKVIVKGILDAEDAKLAVAHGADAIIVSNHGGRQLDGAPSSIRVLPEIVAAVGSKTEIHLDGGIRSGQDILKAVALGAKSTYIGRAFLYGLGAGGEAGVTRVLEIIRKEMDITMALCGERDIRNIGAHTIYQNKLVG